MNDDDKSALKEFMELVNMSPKKIGAWLETDDSKTVGYKEGGKGESVGHKSGRKIIGILESSQDDLAAADLRHVHKVIGYIKRHLAQRPDGNVTETNWRFSLMNWGHDPTLTTK